MAMEYSTSQLLQEGPADRGHLLPLSAFASAAATAAAEPPTCAPSAFAACAGSSCPSAFAAAAGSLPSDLHHAGSFQGGPLVGSEPLKRKPSTCLSAQGSLEVDSLAGLLQPAAAGSDHDGGRRLTRAHKRCAWEGSRPRGMQHVLSFGSIFAF